MRLAWVNSSTGRHWLFLVQDEAGAAAILATELDDALGGKAKQFRELQAHESKEFAQVLSLRICSDLNCLKREWIWAWTLCRVPLVGAKALARNSAPALLGRIVTAAGYM